MSLHRTARALKTTSRQRNESSLRDGAHTSKNPTPTLCPGTLDMDEATLRKLTRAALQKLAKVCFTFLVLNATVTDLTIGKQGEGKHEEQFDHRRARKALQGCSAMVSAFVFDAVCCLMIAQPR